MLILAWAPRAYCNTEPAPWLQVVRHTPYVYSHNWFRNLSDIRRWVLTESGYCSEQDRHLLFDIRAEFLTYQDDRMLREATQRQINATRQVLAEKGKVHTWVAGSKDQVGYPFALACNQPHVDLNSALARLLGWHEDFWVWGSWNGIKVGSKTEPVPLIEMVKAVYAKQSRLQKLPYAEQLWPLFVGQIVIESGAVKYTRSAAQALGMMQLMPAVLEECGILGRHQQHRMAQIECAAKLYGQNHRRLQPVFEQRFGHLPGAKQQQLYQLLLVQAYHGGVGRIMGLLVATEGDDTRNAAEYFAQHHQRFSAEDIALGLIYHNLGRNRLGLASLYYLVDVQLAVEAIKRHNGFNKDL
jgi:hypothetical protein